MRLKQVKLAGFKSFVDPTTVSFPGNRSAVVGPNGCGKSNIIDAVRWVMGESSARQLRGEALTDVIFNGSIGREPTAIASIELTFDNSDGRIGGEYARYSEIAIRRQVTRDAQSAYFLNGSKCRRRDIVDIFLGTGFGPRSYSIIEQGMISQLVEAKPDELRVYLEEAAGISKYKERRRETENRIKHTIENLQRLADIREELERQLAHLSRQAKAAERYRELKADQRKLSAELYALRLRTIGVDLGRLDERLQALDRERREAATAQSGIDLQLEKARVEHGEQTGQFNTIQGRFYQLGADIARSEEAIQYNQSRVKQLELDLESVGQRSEETARQLAMDEQQITSLDSQIEAAAPQLSNALAADQSAAEVLVRLEHDVRDRQAAWDEFSHRASLNDSDSQVQASRIEHIEQLLQRLRSRLTQLDDEAERPAADGETEIDDLADELQEIERTYAALDADVEACIKSFGAAREDVLMRERVLDEARGEVHALRHELAALEAMQQAALGREVNEAKEWIAGQDLVGAPRLGENLVVVRGWENAIETVLGDNLQAIKVDNVASYAAELAALEKGRVVLFEGVLESRTEGDLPALATLVRADGQQFGSLLAGVFAADSLDVALRYRGKLGPSESIITRDGIWLGPDWIRRDLNRDQDHGVIERGQQLEVLRSQVEDAEMHLAELQARVAEGKRRAAEFEAERDRLQARQTAVGERMSELRTRHGVHRVRLEEADARRERVAREKNDIEGQVSAEAERLTRARGRLRELAAEAELLVEERRKLTAVRDAQSRELETARQRSRQLRDAYHALRIEHQGLESALTASRTARDRLVALSSDLGNQVVELKRHIVDGEQPLPEMRDKLDGKLAERLAVEKELTEVRQALSTLEGTITDFGGRRAESESRIDGLRSQLETVRVEREGLSVKHTSLVDQLRETGVELADAQRELPDGADPATWVEALEKLDRRVQRLGPINLAAIDEFETQSERKIYLDAQNEDLEEALATLKSAIAKIDKETRGRFKTTFDQVNEHLQVLFPKVFGGGHAYLELTGEDMLDTGVSLMARPPGKRNASIHLLSGGEKALTAVALIFAIFQLNPSPVCLLDEVDAPLDDTNVSRFAELIREMSSDVQFVVITHNKLTMEMADHLMGVTMHEPGVSRLVSVDVEEAAALAAV